MRKSITEVGVMTEDMTGQERRDCGTEGSCIEHKD